MIVQRTHRVGVLRQTAVLLGKVCMRMPPSSSEAKTARAVLLSLGRNSEAHTHARKAAFTALADVAIADSELQAALLQAVNSHEQDAELAAACIGAACGVRSLCCCAGDACTNVQLECLYESAMLSCLVCHVS
jgi:hypothetical protein